MQGARADAQGILLSFYSSAAAFVNGKCACFLPGFLGRAQKSPGRGRTIWNARRVRFAHIQRKNYFYFAFVALCGALQTHFHGRVYLLFFRFHCSRRTHARRER